MITKGDIKNYSSLFEDISKKLGLEEGEYISDINDYFMELDNIKKYVLGSGTASNPAQDPIYLILPQGDEEELFKIDANKRSITVPDSFKNNGIGVAGDEIAEILYFSIDRYFDTADLFDKEIFIQWETPDGGTGLSPAINKTLSYPNKEGYIVFGWPITSELTAAPGNIKFSIRFYEKGIINDKPVLKYSFGTLTAVVKVNSALNFSIVDEDVLMSLVDKNQWVYDNLRSSEATGVEVPASIPVFDINAFKPENKILYLKDKPELIGRAMFAPNQDTSSKGLISYSWSHENKDTTISTLADTSIYKEIDETEIKNENDTYYWVNDGKYSVYVGSIPANDPEIKIYKKYASLKPSEAGQYYLEAINTAGRGNSASIGSNVDNICVWEIPFAKIPRFTYPNNGKHIIIREDMSEGINAGVVIDDKDYGSQTYQWKKDGENLEGKTNEIFPKEDLVEGIYNLLVKNTVNNDTAEATSEDIRVTYPAQIPVIKGYAVDGNEVVMSGNLISVNLSGGAKQLTVSIEEKIPSDTYLYQWYNEDIEIEGATQATYAAEANGSYSVKITNEYNKDLASINSGKFIVY